jgi:hypothetical protein
LTYDFFFYLEQIRYGNGKWRPAEGTDEQLQYTYWLHTAEGKRAVNYLDPLPYANSYSLFFFEP